MTPDDKEGDDTKHTMCGCGKNAASDEPHYCPYALEIHDDPSDDYCWCCDECMDNCQWSI
jgi:hypothetical protein